MMANEKSQKNPNIFFCNFCKYNTVIKKDYDKHLLTPKHFRLTNANKNPKKSQQDNFFLCNCGKSYKHMSSLCKHKKICTFVEENNTNIIETSDKDLIMLLIKENSELKNMMIDVCQKIQPSNTTNSHNTNHSHNKTFNLQFFLNETCKDAMNIMDFVDSIKLQLSDLEKVGELGYVNGISNIIVKNLNSLEETQRPIHCTDTKREVLYIKDEDKWEKEDEEKKKLRKAIKKVVYKNQKMITKFKEEHPDCGKSTSNFSDQYNKIIVESMGGPGENDLEKEDKIIKHIAKGVTIDKGLY